MIMLWIKLLFLHQGYSLVPVKTVQLGEPAVLTCMLFNEELSTREVHWYKQSPGDTLKLIVTLWKSTHPDYAPEYSKSIVDVQFNNSFSNLTILRVSQEDEGMYHCAVTEWIKTNWRATYLVVKDNNPRTSNYTVVQHPAASGPGLSDTLQCSVLSDSQSKSCLGDLSMFWFRSHKSHADIIFTDGHRQDECEERSDSQKRCVYRFSKNISSSDSGTYYCALATCGEILFGRGTRLDVQESSSLKAEVGTILQCAILVICLVVIAVLLCALKKKKCDCCKAEDLHAGGLKLKLKDDGTWIYSVVLFNMIKPENGAVTAERERIYTAVKAFGLE
ncbi:uncharacterized protein LOC114442348 [Parambassis ranga]|uniref:Uncharacterized protein LOC114442348 n=1 Tax=Parambassis ranga TaxID=210632 RepID=A0A6P7J4W7_9TELE|nr:uncharacterized protein LOC114442348 [Parambassis ranga]